MCTFQIVLSQTSGDYRSLQSGNWEDPSTWQIYSGGSWQNASSAPSQSDGAISILNPHTVTINSSFSIDQLTVNNGGALTIASGNTVEISNTLPGTNLAINGTLTTAGKLLLNGDASLSGTLSVTDSIIINNGATFSWSSGVLSGAGNITTQTGGTFLAFTSDTKTIVGTTISVFGHFQWTGGVLYGQSSCTILVQSGGEFSTNFDGTIAWNGVSTSWTVTNHGTFRKHTATGVTTFNSFNFVNDGIVDIQSGQLNLNSGGTFNSGSTFTGAGITYCVSGTFLMNGTINTTNLILWNGTYIGTHTIVGTLSWYDGSTEGSSTDTTYIAQGSTLQIPGNTTKTISYRTIYNRGTIDWTSTSLIYLAYNAKIVNDTTGIFEIKNNQYIAWNGVGTRGEIRNYGLIRKSIGTGTTSINETALYNYGTIDVQTGLIVFNGQNNGFSTGTFNVNNGSLISFNDGSYTWNTGTTFSGTGTMQINGATISVTDTNGLVMPSQTLFSLASGTLTGNGLLRVYGEMSWSGGTQSGTGRTQIDTSGTLTISSSSVKELSARTLRNYGTIHWLGTGVFYGNASSLIENMPSGLFNIENDATMAWNGVSTQWTINNKGTLRKQTATGATSFNSFSFINDGTVDIQSGQLYLNSGAIFNSGSTFSGAGNTYCITGTFQMNGTINTQNLYLWNGTYVGTHTIVGTLSWYSGDFSGNATDTTTISEGSTLNVLSSSVRTISYRTLYNQGTIDWATTTTWYLSYDTKVINAATGVFAIKNDQILAWNGVGTRGAIYNYGTIRKTPGTGTSTLMETAVHNHGIIDIQTGTLIFSGQNDGVSTGSFTINSGSLVSFNSGVYTWGTGTTITGNGTMQINGGTVIVTDTNGIPVSPQTTFSLADGALTGNGLLKINGTLNWTGGSQNGSGRTEIDSSASATISGGSLKSFSDRTIRNYGTIRWQGTGVIYGSGSSLFENMSTGLFQMENDATLTWNGVSTQWTFKNYGTIRKLATTGATSYSSFNFINNGTVDIQSGQLNLHSGATFNSGSSFTGAGLTYCINGTFQLNGTINTQNLIWWGGIFYGKHTINGTLSWYDGSLAGLATDTTVIAEGSLFNVTGSAIKYLYSRTIFNRGTIDWSGTGNWYTADAPTIVNSETGLFHATANNNFEWAGLGSRGYFINNGILRKSIGTGTTYFGENYLTNNGTIEANTGLITIYRLTNVSGSTPVGGTYDITASLRIYDIAIDSNRASIILRGSSASLQNWSGGNALANFTTNTTTGSFSIRNGKIFTSTNAFINRGTVSVGDSSIFTSPANYTQTSGSTTLLNGTLTASSTIDIQQGILSGTGTINGTLNNSDSVAIGTSPGTLVINGNYVQNTSSDLLFDIGGYNEGTEYDRLLVHGSATLAGNVITSLVNNFIPLQGDTFSLITANLRDGEFDFYYGTAIDDERAFDPRYDSTHFYMLTFDTEIPHLVTPVNNSVNMSRTVFHTWNPLIAIRGYQFQISTDSSFSSTLLDTIVDETTQKVLNLDYLTKYYWHVKGIGYLASTGWSETWGYTTIIQAPLAPVLESPNQSALNQSVTPLFKWQHAIRAASYDVQISTDSLFTSNIILDSTVTDSSLTSPSLQYITKYFWRVRSENAGGVSSWSSHREFTTIIEAPAQPNPVAPLDSAEHLPLSVTMVWDSSARAESYRIQVSLSPSFTSLFHDTTITGLTSTVSGLTNFTRYFWRVQALNLGGTSAWSVIRNFKTIIAAPSIPILTAPKNDSVLLLLTAELQWQASDRAEAYYLEIDSTNLFSSPFVTDTLFNNQFSVTLPSFGTPYFWKVKALNAGGESGFSTISSFSVAEFYATYSNRWNMLSLPVESHNTITAVLFPSATSQAYKFDSTLGYVQQETLSTATGYWLKFPGSTTITFSGASKERDTIELNSGWNLIGSISYPVNTSSIVSEPESLMISPFWEYDGQYKQAEIVQPGKAYWVLTEQPGRIILDRSFAATHPVTKQVTERSIVNFTITDAEGISQTLSIASETPEHQSRIALPPVPPMGVFDVRFSSGFSREFPEQISDKSIRILLSSASYPVTVSWEGTPGENPGTITSGSKTYTLSHNGKFIAYDEETAIKVLISSKQTQALPVHYTLNQNYPNPFNPSTVISYQLPFESHVSLRVFTALGSEVAVITDGIQDAGNHSIEFTASDLPTGVYFYKIVATPLASEKDKPFTDMKKLLLVK